MKFLTPTSRPRLNEAVAVVLLFAGLYLLVSLASYHPFDPSWNTATDAPSANLGGRVGAVLSDVLLQGLGLAAWTIPALILFLAWNWLRSTPIASTWIKSIGALLIVGASCAAFGFASNWHPISNIIPAGGFLGAVLAETLRNSMNTTGAAMFTAVCWILGLYFISKFEMAKLRLEKLKMPKVFSSLGGRWKAWQQTRIEHAKEKAAARTLRKKETATGPSWTSATADIAPAGEPPIIDPLNAPFVPRLEQNGNGHGKTAKELADIPIRPLETEPPKPVGPVIAEMVRPARASVADHSQQKRHTAFRLPPTSLLQEPAPRNAFDSQELKETASRIKSKFEEFNVRGSVTQINPGPVVTTFEFKPEAGVKYTRITTLVEDLCLGLQAESILIERIPGKPTVGIEVPNSRREVISLRQILESEEFHASASPLTVALGKDINGRIKVAALDSMPHLLIAGSTGSGKSVMLNSLIMSILFKTTPEQVRMIMVDPKRLEFGLYEGVPHLLTPVITDPKKATNALRNAVMEMERRLKLLASQGVRNIDQYNKKIRALQARPKSLFEEENGIEPLQPIPYILILIDELADLMMLERANVEESVARLAQMARAVGMHLVLATQRPSVDVITGLIKANFPSRISFRVATRVDSRTVLDVMGAEHLLGKGDMLFLPPGSSRLVRVHGSYVSEAETNDVVEFWKQQAQPEYDQSFLLAPPSEEDEEAEEFDGTEDPMYQDAVRVVLEMGKASTSTLQRRLRLGYGRAARILDMMQREGIIGPPDGSRPRDVLKRPDWLAEVENQLK